MELNFDRSLAERYHSNAQRARIMTESWVETQMFCPRCGNAHIHHFSNNKPVADFYCPLCHAEYELKSKNGTFGSKINDGAYQTMIERITSDENPDFFFMCYSKQDLKVKDFFFVPRFFFVPDMIEQRKPLSDTAQRAGWTGCSILIHKIPKQGRISIIDNGVVVDRDAVLKQVQKSEQLRIDDISSRGWLMDVLNCINRIPTREFLLSELYAFEGELSEKHPRNHHIRPKIRQQLQILRDKGFLEFLEAGSYKKSS